MKKPGRNDPCPCGSGRKYKQCCTQYGGSAVREAADKVAWIRPSDTDRHYDLGNALRAQGKWDEAIACYRSAIAIEPDHVNAHHDLGDALYHRGELREAAASYRNALLIKPDAADLHYNLGGALRDLGELGDAITCYRRAISIKHGSG